MGIMDELVAEKNKELGSIRSLPNELKQYRQEIVKELTNNYEEMLAFIFQHKKNAYWLGYRTQKVFGVDWKPVVEITGIGSNLCIDGKNAYRYSGKVKKLDSTVLTTKPHSGETKWNYYYYYPITKQEAIDVIVNDMFIVISEWSDEICTDYSINQVLECLEQGNGKWILPRKSDRYQPDSYYFDRVKRWMQEKTPRDRVKNMISEVIK